MIACYSRIESEINLETIKQSYTNTVDKLNNELLLLKEKYEQVNIEKQLVNNKQEKSPVESYEEQNKKIKGNYYIHSLY